MKYRLIYLFLISFFLFATSSCNRTVRHDRKVFQYAMENLGIVLPADVHTFIFVTREGCSGCKPLTLLYAKQDNSDTVTFITTHLLAADYNLPARDNIIIDSSLLIERLNWSLHGIIEVRCQDGIVTFMDDYDARNIEKRFLPMISL